MSSLAIQMGNRQLQEEVSEHLNMVLRSYLQIGFFCRDRMSAGA